MIEIFILYNKITGFINGAGRIDRELDVTNADGSTTLEWITRVLTNDPDRDVIYLSNQDLPDRNVSKIDKGELVRLTATEEVTVKQPEVDEELIQEEVLKITRATAIQNLKDRGELAVDY